MPEVMTGKYMKATREPLGRGKKTHAYSVVEISTGYILGVLKWYGPWRGYCFFPGCGMVFDGHCLTQLDAWIAELNAEHKTSKEKSTDARGAS